MKVEHLLILQMINQYPNINYNILGSGQWKILNGIMIFTMNWAKCKIALNLSRGLPIKYTSSNRIAPTV